MISTSEMQCCHIYRFMIVFLSLHGSMMVQASRSLDFAPGVAIGSSLKLRSLQEMQDDSIATADVNPEKLPHKDRLSGANWKEFSEKLLARQMGSKPPNCDGKCDLCLPCEAVEVPISNHSVQKVQEDSQHPSTFVAQPDDTNYMPESWRCACGNEYYNP
ncbi:unnamed protein product [Calypogeia fissa]